MWIRYGYPRSRGITLQSLARSVRPELKPIVRKSHGQLDTLRSAHDRFREQISRQVELLGDKNSSLRRELGEMRTALDGVRQARDSWRDAYRDLEPARIRWREAVRVRPVGLPPETTHAAAAALGFGLGNL